jgi:phosphoribosylanthranilate isomerase
MLLPRVKICGLTSLEAAAVATEAGADLVGLVFYPPSPRNLTPEKAAEISTYLCSLENRPAMVGLFVNESRESLEAAVEAYRLDFLQLAGDETPEACRDAVKLRPVIKSIRLKPPLALENALAIIAPYATLANVTVLLDGYKTGMYGGTGERGDWELAREIAARFPVILAGGLNPANVAEAVAQAQPWGVDVSSGVEKEGQPGQKDLAKIREFIAKAKTFKQELF